MPLFLPLSMACPWPEELFPLLTDAEGFSLLDKVGVSGFSLTGTSVGQNLRLELFVASEIGVAPYFYRGAAYVFADLCTGTWEELAAMAKKIQDGERAAGKPDFQGFVFQGRASEGLTCNALEWIYSYGGGSVIEPDKKITINNPNAIKALDNAHSWVGTISPAGVTTYDEEEALKIWQAGNAAFMRNWPFAYARGSDPKSPIAGKFDVTVLPKGGDSGKNAACLGGWQFMISAYSKVPDAVADLVRYLCSAEIQKKRTIDWSLLPTRPALYSDPDVLAKYPFFKIMPNVFNNAVARPSTVTGADYNQLSTAFFQNVSKVLTGAESGKDAVDQVEGVAKSIVH